MRVLQVVSAGDINGAVMHVWNVMHQLQNRGHEVFLACPPGAWLATQFPADQVIETNMTRWPLHESRRIARMIRELQIDVTHTHQSRAHSFGVMLRWLFGIPSVATAHNCRIQLHWALNNQVIGVSEQTTRFHRRFNGVRGRRMTTVHNFVDVDQFQFNRGSRECVRDELGIDARRTVGVILGTVMEKKGLHYAVEALPSVLRQAPDFHLLIVGSPRPRDVPYHEQLQRQARHLGVEDRITWAGTRNDVAALLNASDMLVSASLEENFPISLLEAMACGLPTVATRVGGVPECVLDGETGRLAPAKNVAALIEAIVELCDPAAQARCGAAARQRVVAHFSASSQIPKLEAVLGAAMGRPASSVESVRRTSGEASMMEAQPLGSGVGPVANPVGPGELS